jgi:Prealbumin-like fold domain
MNVSQQYPFAFIILIVAAFPCLCLGQTGSNAESDASTGIEGVISISPIHGGPFRVGVANSKPLANVSFVVQDGKGIVSSFTTDDQGRFKVSLASGHYTVAMKEGKPRLGYYGPFEVEVAPGKITKVQWNCDTGMR